MADTTPALDFRQIQKRYGGILALNDVSVQVTPGTVRSFIGENGAGKSTLLGIASGRTPATSGEVRIDGQLLKQGSPRSARALGLITIYQELTVVPGRSVLENVFLGAMPRRVGLLDTSAAKKRFVELCERAGRRLNPDVPAGSLSVGDQQLIEIMRSMVLDAKIVLFDEPTAALSEAERDAFFKIVHDLKGEGRTVVLVSHNLEEVLQHSDDISVFRNGRFIERRTVAEWTKPSMVEAMIGEEKALGMGEVLLSGSSGEEGPRIPDDAPTLMRATVTVPGKMEGIEVTVREGEVLGIAGLAGSGRSTLLRSLAGIDRRARGELALAGEEGKLPGTPPGCPAPRRGPDPGRAEDPGAGAEHAVHRQSGGQQVPARRASGADELEQGRHPGDPARGSGRLRPQAGEAAARAALRGQPAEAVDRTLAAFSPEGAAGG